MIDKKSMREVFKYSFKVCLFVLKYLFENLYQNTFFSGNRNTCA